MFSVRKLAAIDIAFLGPTFVILEFALGVVGALALGLFAAFRARSASGALIAAYLLSISINYVPLLLHAVSLRERRRAREEMADELTPDPRRTMRKYRRGSLLLLIPLVMPILALAQARRPRGIR